MDFQIEALPAAPFEGFFQMSDEALAQRHIKRIVVDDYPAAPCRISLRDIEIGQTVLLLNYAHQPNDTPYKATHAIYVGEDGQRAVPQVNEVPEMIASRLISMRLFDADHMIVDADVVDGRDLSKALEQAFEDASVDYAQLHFAKRGCFAATAHRAG
jgi:hypothetical protein